MCTVFRIVLGIKEGANKNCQVRVNWGLSGQQGGMRNLKRKGCLDPCHLPSWGPLPRGSHQLCPLWALRGHRLPVPKCSITFWSSPANSPLMSGPKGGIIGSPPLNYLRTHHPSLTSCQHGAKPQRPGILGQAGTPPSHPTPCQAGRSSVCALHALPLKHTWGN